MNSLFTHLKSLTFPGKFFISDDKKTILGETRFRDILFLDYRDTEAGSNPREYTGLKKTNGEILKSLLRDYKNIFRFLHSGIIVSLTGLKIINDSLMKYDSCCLTNGNQTRFIILILVLLKLYSIENDISNINEKSYKSFIKEKFKNKNDILNFLSFVKYTKVAEMYRFLLGNGKYLKSFNDMELDVFLDSKIRIQVNVLEKIIEPIDDLDEYDAGTLIAQANNETQHVKVDDIFGSRHKKALPKFIFDNFISTYGDSVKIEYRLGEVIERGSKVHILTLLRPVVATGILTREKDIFRLSNQRTPIYNLFGKLLRNLNKGDEKARKTVESISKIIPLLYDIRENYIIPQLKLYKNIFFREYREKAINKELDTTTIRDRIKFKDGELMEDSIDALKKITNFNIDHIIPVVVFRVRKIIKLNPSGELALTVPEKDIEKFFKTMIQAIYKSYIELKLIGTAGSITDGVRKAEFFKNGEEGYEALKNVLNFEETHFIEENKFIA